MSLNTVLRTTQSKFRRNGKLQACEPCRTRKIRYDHGLPTCERCIKSKREAQCHYHFAPLTRANGGHAPAAPPIGSATPDWRRTAASTSSPSTTALQASTINNIGEGEASPSEVGNLGYTRFSEVPPMPKHTSNVGYLGPTSFSEVFKASKHTSDDVWLGSLAQIKGSFGMILTLENVLVPKPKAIPLR